MKIRHYTLRICYPPENNLHEAITNILATTPNEAGDGRWELYIREEDDGPYYDFINTFLDILEGKYEVLKGIGIERDDIIIFAVYEYWNQCNLEFSPSRLARLGANNIEFFIRCWYNEELAEPYVEDMESK